MLSTGASKVYQERKISVRHPPEYNVTTTFKKASCVNNMISNTILDNETCVSIGPESVSHGQSSGT